MTEALLKKVQTFESGLALYRDRQWNDAISLFNTVQKLEGGDPASRMYIGRCEEYRKHPPGEEWDGVYVMTGK